MPHARFLQFIVLQITLDSIHFGYRIADRRTGGKDTPPCRRHLKGLARAHLMRQQGIVAIQHSGDSVDLVFPQAYFRFCPQN